MSEVKENTIEIKSVKDLLKMKLYIPDYQRPYKWTIPNIESLLNDICNCTKEAEKFDNFKYRIGTIILHKDKKHKYNIVDGQQRIISLVLLENILNGNSKNNNFEFSNKISQKNIHDNLQFCRQICFPINKSVALFLEFSNSRSLFYKAGIFLVIVFLSYCDIGVYVIGFFSIN